jgi:Animal haem peroxidase
MSSSAETKKGDDTQPFAAPELPGETVHDGEENECIPAGYTYLGQFVDHDITFDPSSSLHDQNNIEEVVNRRTPRLDLDCLYGHGPDDQPYMYESKGRKFVLGEALLYGSAKSPSHDLPRFEQVTDGVTAKRALIGDKRNDENVIVSQLHGVFLKFHNRLADDYPHDSLEEIRQRVRWHYQYVVVNDFLPKMCGDAAVKRIFRNGGKDTHFRFYERSEPARIPVEFSVAAYRFGHSMVRPVYRLNTNPAGGGVPQATPADKENGLEERLFIFAGVQERGLNGFDAFPRQWGIDWSLFFDINGSGKKVGRERVQPSYKIDTSLVNPLAFLPEFSERPLPAKTPLTTAALQSKESDPKKPANLALRNLLRGNAMSLVSGQEAARCLGFDPIPTSNLWVGKAQFGDQGKEDAVKVNTNAAFKADVPLWYYVLAEGQSKWYVEAKTILGNAAAPSEDKIAAANRVPMRLGDVGSCIISETLIGLIVSDADSYLSSEPLWTPTVAKTGATFTMSDFIKFALKI